MSRSLIVAATLGFAVLTTGCAGNPEVAPQLDLKIAAKPTDSEAIRERVTLMLAQGDLAVRDGKIDQAFYLYMLAEALDPADSRALEKTGNLHRTLGNRQLAGDAWRLALARNPYNGTTLENFAFLSLELGQYDEALRSFESALKLTTSERALAGKGLTLERQGAFLRALEHYDSALLAYPKSTELLTYRARTLMSLGRLDEARRVIASIAEEPQQATWIVRGDLFALDGTYAAALGSYVEALPEHWAYQRLGEHALRRKDFSEALRYFTNAATVAAEFFEDAERGATVAREYLRIQQPLQ